jgi:hypothetical protein
MGVGGFEGRVEPDALDLGLHHFTHQTAAVRSTLGRVQFDQHVAGADGLTVPDVDVADDAQFLGLDQLAALVRNDPPIGHRDHIDICPDTNTVSNTETMTRPKDQHVERGQAPVDQHRIETVVFIR